MSQRFDAIVIGAGQAGPSLAMRLGQEGLETLLVERRHLGGSCVNFGCTPTKTMVASARAAWMARRAHELGVQIDGEERVTGERLLIGLGRRPNSDDLGLDEAGIETGEHGYIHVDERLRTTAEGVWALGDVNGEGAFTHTAYNDFQIVADQLFGSGERTLAERIPAHAVYLDPPLGRVGLGETETRARSRPPLMAKMSMSGVARAKERGETRGFMKVLVDPESDRILGATVLGTGGDEVVHTFLALMAARAPSRVLRRAMGIHPTVSELIPSLLERLEPIAPPVERP
jgi:pyruvate/2-oxoglutarate dehydrogenase complex dihydrolipoamide dehydrogenase (E3) component